MSRQASLETTITHIGTATPSYGLDQSESLEFLRQFMACDAAAYRKLQAIHRYGGIQHRYSVLPLLARHGAAESFYSRPSSTRPAPDTPSRQQIFDQEAMPLVHQAIKDAGIDADMLASVTHLITVSCTGVTAPGLDIDMLEQLPISRQIQRTHITFMGCYAAITALAQAQAWCRSVPGARVLVVDVELCSLHFQSEATEDNLLANSLFADGAAAVLIQSGDPEPSGLRIDGFCSEVLLEGRHEMGWRVSSYGYQMRLSGVVPDYIAPAVPGFLERVADEMKLQNQPLRLLLHPGGKRIVDAVARVRAMNPEDRERSLYVLRRYGNMSSVTILFILRDVLYETHEPIEDQAFLAMAFGPGLCMESCLLRRRHD